MFVILFVASSGAGFNRYLPKLQFRCVLTKTF